ncbi:unnamed protein product [Arabidopsis arenosa]|uniref:MATH domain-containing protein n=1 Tax=Arabidopsis arenosa TaxID=38785 RepID=A0A8S2AG39_ARAAE|nr:unnamed protein product [Arabidopsis arenosa]
MWNQKPSFRFEIDNFSEKKTVITSQVFVSGGCECTPFCAESPSWGWRYFLSLSKFQKTGLLEDDRLIIEVYINIVEAFDGEEEDVSSEKEETVDINGFHVVATQRFWSAMWNQKPCFRFEIDNFSEKKDVIVSQTFVSGGCEWFLCLYPKGNSRSDDHMSLFLYVANSKSLGSGWKRSANYYFSVLNQSEKELYRSPVGQEPPLFRVEGEGWGFRKILPLSKFEEKGFLEKDRLIIEVYIKVVEAVDGEGGGVSKKKETVDIIGSEDYASQASLKGSVSFSVFE